MHLRAVSLFIVLAFCAFAFADEGINTGEGLQALLFVGNGGVELSNTISRSTLADVLPLSFTFEAWVMLPNNPADGFYKTIVSHWDVGPFGVYHNRWAHFNFQVQASGTLNFFMGNGLPSAYGILRGTTTLNQGQWTHVAFSVYTPPGQITPQIARVYYDLLQWNTTWTEGDRQIPDPARGRNIHLGDFFNQDGDNKYWRGYIDEVRFWGLVRTDTQLASFYKRVVPYDTAGLLAYYRFNDGAGLLLSDSTANKFDGRLSRTTLNTSTPLWRVSGAKIDVDVHVDPKSSGTIFLPGFSPRGSLGFTYVIATLPDSFGSAGVGRLVADGQIVTSVPFALTSNTVTYEAPNSTGVTVSFTYYGSYDPSNPSAHEAEATTVNVQVGEAPCIPDVCGKCGGDNSTCTCLPLPYNGYNLQEIERILLLYEIEQTLELLTQLEGKLEVTMKTLPQHKATELQTLISTVQNFNTGCLIDFCGKIDKYMDSLAALSSS